MMHLFLCWGGRGTYEGTWGGNKARIWDARPLFRQWSGAEELKTAASFLTLSPAVCCSFSSICKTVHMRTTAYLALSADSPVDLSS